MNFKKQWPQPLQVKNQDIFLKKFNLVKVHNEGELSQVLIETSLRH